MPFTKLGLAAEILKGARDLGFRSPTAIQELAIPPALAGRDLLATSSTGSGKTAAFALPILERLLRTKPDRRATRALVLTPTRELAAQVAEHANALAEHTPLGAAAIHGGVGMGPQEHALRQGVDIIVATPGRLLDHLRMPYARLDRVEVVVLDEADRMLDMGFLPDVRRILKSLPGRRQTLLFSATLPQEIRDLSREWMKDPVTIGGETRRMPAATIRQALYPVPAHLKGRLLVTLLERDEIASAIVFSRTKHRADRLAQFLSQNGVSAGRIHGDRTQAQRTQALDRFKAGKTRILVATDVAARGIDVEALSHVVNFDVPKAPEDYVHRVGRTGRNEASGDALTFVAPDEENLVRAIEKSIGHRLQRVTVPDFRYDARAEAKPGPHGGAAAKQAEGGRSEAPGRRFERADRRGFRADESGRGRRNDWPRRDGRGQSSRPGGWKKEQPPASSESGRRGSGRPTYRDYVPQESSGARSADSDRHVDRRHERANEGHDEARGRRQTGAGHGIIRGLSGNSGGGSGAGSSRFQADRGGHGGARPPKRRFGRRG